MSADGLLDGAQVDAFEVPIASQGVTTEVRDRAMRASKVRPETTDEEPA